MIDTIYVIGAGTSVYAGAPTMNNLMKEAHINGFIGSRLKRFIKSFYQIELLDNKSYPPFEEILSMIDLAKSRRDALVDKRKDEFINLEVGFIDALQFDIDFLISHTLQKKIKEKEEGENFTNYMNIFIDRIIPDKSKIDVAFISLNYDVLLDNAILQKINENQQFSPTNFPINYGTKLNWCCYENNYSRVRFEKNAIILIKPHGSLNLLHCDACGSLLITLYEKGLYRLFHDDINCPEDRLRLSSFIVPPTWIKQFGNPHLVEMWQNINELLSNCKKLIFLGYSLPDADIFFKYMIKRSLMRNRNNIEIEAYTLNSNDEGEKYQRTFKNISFESKTFQNYVNSL